ncbi:MAG: hypothetical protein KKA73_14835 [Chloroflexi bacterium]|nr:hypothetical protein [Chloroflexota bacterium]MBU1748962.1 hypothetical protein [Chloroflexota bacterium]
MILSLENDGDLWEQKYWHLIRESFPNYEVFWKTFIVPLSNRIQYRKDQRIRCNLDPVLEQLAMTHYSVFRHFITTHRLLGQADFAQLDKLPQGDTVFFHLAATTEMIDRLLMIISRIKVKVRIQREPTFEEVKPGFSQMEPDQARLQKEFTRLLETGRNMAFPICNIRDVAKTNLGDLGPDWKKDLGQFHGLSDKIRTYRNYFTHNPILAMQLDDGKQPCIPKYSALKNYAQSWSSVFYGANEDDFVPLEGLLWEYFNDLLQAANRLWGHLIPLLRELGEESAYREMANWGDWSQSDWLQAIETESVTASTLDQRQAMRVLDSTFATSLSQERDPGRVLSASAASDPRAVPPLSTVSTFASLLFQERDPNCALTASAASDPKAIHPPSTVSDIGNADNDDKISTQEGS